MKAPVPEPAPDGVLIKVHAAGVNPVDWKIRKGLMRQARPLHFPAVLGSDIAGTVERTGPIVTRFKHGDPVVARVEGAYAEFATAKTDAVAPAPTSIPLAMRLAYRSCAPFFVSAKFGSPFRR
jgi:NADPH:quinone reductase-like Zn-dependent oxidoreductase